MNETLDAFCQNIAKGMRRGEAAAAAKPSLTKGSAATMATSWLKKPEVQLRIAILRGAADDEDLAALEAAVKGTPYTMPPQVTITSNRVEVFTKGDRDKIAAGLWKLARICMGEEFAEKEIQDKDGKVLLFERHRAVDAKSAIRALELLGKIDTVGLFVERKRLDVKTEVENMSDAELDAEIDKYSKQLN